MKPVVTCCTTYYFTVNYDSLLSPACSVFDQWVQDTPTGNRKKCKAHCCHLPQSLPVKLLGLFLALFKKSKRGCLATGIAELIAAYCFVLTLLLTLNHLLLCSKGAEQSWWYSYHDMVAQLLQKIFVSPPAIHATWHTWLSTGYFCLKAPTVTLMFRFSADNCFS